MQVDDDEDLTRLGRCFVSLGKNRPPYAMCYANGKLQYVHRVLANAPPRVPVDHLNRDSLDNRKPNLKVCTPQQNARNRRPGGVSYSAASRKWKAYIGMGNNRVQHLGYFDTEEEARQVRSSAETVLW